MPRFRLFFWLLLVVTSVGNAKSIDGFASGAEGVRIHYLASGSEGAARTLLLIPGWRVSAFIWSQQLNYFASRGFRVIAIDSRSQGESTLTTVDNAPEDRANDIQQVIASLHLQNVVLVGWSQGAQDVAAYVNRFGSSDVKGLALIDSPVSAGPADITLNPEFLKVIASGLAIYSKHPREYSDGMMHAIMHAPPVGMSFSSLDTIAMRTPVDTGISMLVQDLFTTDRRAYLKKFDKPTLVIASGQSPLIDAQRQMARNLPKGKFLVIEHAAHAVFVDQPDIFDRTLETFAQTLDKHRREN